MQPLCVAGAWQRIAWRAGPQSFALSPSQSNPVYEQGPGSGLRGRLALTQKILSPDKPKTNQVLCKAGASRRTAWRAGPT